MKYPYRLVIDGYKGWRSFSSLSVRLKKNIKSSAKLLLGEEGITI